MAMDNSTQALSSARHSHSFLGAGHEKSERKTWAVIWLCGAMMSLEILGGILFGSIALVADGLHMSTHAGALLLAALAYSYSRKHAEDPRFSFGTGKLGDLAGFTSAIILAMIALLIGYESITRFVAPIPIHFAEAIPIACLGLLVNIASAWLLSDADHGHNHDHHGHEHHDHHNHDRDGPHDDEHDHAPTPAHTHAKSHRDNNMRAAIIHVMADAAVSILVILGLLLARTFGWLWMDPLAGMIGACVIASWSYGLIRDTGAILLDMTPDQRMATTLRQTIESDGDELADLHLWRLGPGHLGAIVCVHTQKARGVDYYRTKLGAFSALSHVTIEVQSSPAAPSH
jgi:cation diffusion facilitator family transporter